MRRRRSTAVGRVAGSRSRQGSSWPWLLACEPQRFGHGIERSENDDSIIRPRVSTRCSKRFSSSVTSACHPGSTIDVAFASAMAPKALSRSVGRKSFQQQDRRRQTRQRRRSRWMSWMLGRVLGFSCADRTSRSCMTGAAMMISREARATACWPSSRRWRPRPSVPGSSTSHRVRRSRSRSNVVVTSRSSQLRLCRCCFVTGDFVDGRQSGDVRNRLGHSMA